MDGPDAETLLALLVYPLLTVMLLATVWGVTSFMRRRWEKAAVPRLRDVLRQIEHAHGDIELAIDGRRLALVVTKGWLHFVPESGATIGSVALTSIVSVEVAETRKGVIELRCDLEDGSRTPEFVTDNISRFAALFNVFVEYGREIRYQTY